MREVGEVIDCDDNIAKVKVVKKSACNKCDKPCPLSSTETHEKKEMVFQLQNIIRAKKGDQVIIEMENRSLVISSLLMYLIPIINMILGYFIGRWVGVSYNIFTAEISGIIGTMVFLFISYLVLRYIDSKLISGDEIKPKLVKKYNKRNEYIKRQ